MQICAVAEANEKARTRWESAPSIKTVAGGLGDQATIKAAWFRAANAAGAKRAMAAAIEKNLVICRLPGWRCGLSGLLMQRPYRLDARSAVTWVTI